MLTSEQIKTLINGLKQAIPPFIKPNWNVNDPKSPNFIEGRTHHVNDDGTVSPLDEKFLPEWPDKYREAAQAQVDAKTVEVFTGGPKEDSKTGALSGEVVGEGFGPMWAFIPDTSEVSGNRIFYGNSKAVPFIGRYFSHIHAMLGAKLTLKNGNEYQIVLRSKRYVPFTTFNTFGSSPYFTGSAEFEYIDPENGLLRSVHLSGRLEYFPLRGTCCLAVTQNSVTDTEIDYQFSKFSLLKVYSVNRDTPIAWTSSGYYPGQPASKRLTGKAPPLYLTISLEETSLTELKVGEPVELTSMQSLSAFEDCAFAAVKQVQDHTVVLKAIRGGDRSLYQYKIYDVYYDTAPELPEQITNFSWVVRLVPKTSSHSTMYLTNNDVYIWWDTSKKRSFLMKGGPLVAFYPELPDPISTGPMVLSTSPTNNCTPEWTPVLGIKSAQVGQTVRVAARNDLGYPTAWEAVDMPKTIPFIELETVFANGTALSQSDSEKLTSAKGSPAIISFALNDGTKFSAVFYAAEADGMSGFMADLGGDSFTLVESDGWVWLQAT